MRVVLYSLSLLKWNSRKRLVPSPYSKLSAATSTQIPKHETTKKGCAIRAIYVWPWKLVSVSVLSLFYQPMDEKIKTWPLLFPAKENPNMALFDWPIVLQHDVKAKYRLILKSSRTWCFPPEHSLNQPKGTPVRIRSINQSNRSISVRLLFLFCSRVFISRW